MAEQIGLFPLVGRLGWVVGQKYRGKYIFRSYVKPKNPQTPAQMANRIRITNACQAFIRLTAAQRTFWDRWAELINQDNMGTIGSTPKNAYTGYTLYMHCNANLLQTGQFLQEQPPNSLTYDGFSVLNTTAIAQVGAGTININATLAFINHTNYNGNYGGVKLRWARECDGRRVRYLPWRTTDRYPFTGAEVSPVVIPLNTGLLTSEIACNIYVQFMYQDQYGLSASNSEIVMVGMV